MRPERVRGAFLTLLILGSGPLAQAEDYTERLSQEQAELEEALIKACPTLRAQVLRTRAGAEPRQRCTSLQALGGCAAALEFYHLQTSSACLAANDFGAAEQSARAAMAIRVTESGQLALLNALVRQEPRSLQQEADLKVHLDYFRKRTCTRDDLCAGLSHVAWHVEDRGLAVRSAERAIALQFPGWQPYFFGGTALAAGSAADRARAKTWLLEAKRRGGPAAIDTFLKDL